MEMDIFHCLWLVYFIIYASILASTLIYIELLLKRDIFVQ